MQASEGHAFLTIILLPPLHQCEPLTPDHPNPQFPGVCFILSALHFSTAVLSLTVTVVDKSPMISGRNPLRERSGSSRGVTACKALASDTVAPEDSNGCLSTCVFVCMMPFNSLCPPPLPIRSSAGVSPQMGDRALGFCTAPRRS